MSILKPRRENTVRHFLHLAGTGVPIRPVADLPHDDSIEFADSVLTPSVHPGLKPGKGLSLARDADFEEHIAHPAVAEFRRPRKFICWCGDPAVLQFPARTVGGEPIRRCLKHPNPDTIAAVRGPGDVA